MKQEGNLYYAGDGKLIVRKADNFIMGNVIDLGSADSIDNYEEKDFTEEEINAFLDKVNGEGEPTEEDLLNGAKTQKILELSQYDRSSAVNSFTIGGQSMWLNVKEREQIATQISANEAVGATEMTRWFNGVGYTFTLAQWKQMLVALEVYAGNALNVTEMHRAAIKALESIEDVEDYDFTVGYPDKLTFGSE